MTLCRTHKISCPYALGAWEELSCVVSTKENCRDYMQKYEREKQEFLDAVKSGRTIDKKVSDFWNEEFESIKLRLAVQCA